MLNFAVRISTMSTEITNNTNITYNEKQLAIMDSALELFVSSGFDKVSVRSVAQASKVNVAMIFYYFGSKEKLLEAIFHYYIQRLKDNWTAFNVDESINTFLLLDNFVHHFVWSSYEVRKFYRLMVRQFTLLERDVFCSDEMGMLQNFINEILQQIIQIGIKRGDFNPYVQPLFIKQIISGAIFHTIAMTERDEKNKKILEDGDVDKTYYEKIKDLDKNLQIIFKSYLKNEIESN